MRMGLEKGGRRYGWGQAFSTPPAQGSVHPNTLPTAASPGFQYFRLKRDYDGDTRDTQSSAATSVSHTPGTGTPVCSPAPAGGPEQLLC